MSPLAASSSQSFATTSAPSPTSTWHVGISPEFPSSLILSDDSAVETLLTDIPFLSVGLLGFGVLTFFFTMRKLNRIAFLIFKSVIIAFIAGVLDVGQVLVRGSAATDADTDVASVLPLLIAREIALSLSIGTRFLFFWSFVSLPPRGERPLISDSQEKRPNFLRMEYDIHSGDWLKWGFLGGLLKYGLLLGVLAVPVLQLIWRLVGKFNSLGPIYGADSILQIVLSALFVIKLLANAWISPLTPRWQTVRDYSPVMFALLIGLGIGVGNILRFEFSETSLGRFFQAVELYILVLYILISSFYKHRTRVSMLGTAQSTVSKFQISPEDASPGDQSNFQISSPSTSAPNHMANRLIPRIETQNLNLRAGNRLSSWLVPDADLISTMPDVTPRRMSTTSRVMSWMTARRESGRKDRTLWNKDDVEGGSSLIDSKTGYAVSPVDNSRAVATRMDPTYPSISGMSTPSERLQRINTALNAPLSSLKTGAVSPDGTISPLAPTESYNGMVTIPPKILNIPGSPVYGLDGIVRYYSQPSPVPRPDSAQSSGMASLLRQQAELDKSVAELQLFSPLSTRPTVADGHPESFRSDFTLSNFPNPPLDAPNWAVENDAGPALRMDDLEVGVVRKAHRSNATTLVGVPATTRPVRLLELSMQARRRQSFPSTRSSSDSAVLGAVARSMVGSGGTLYDVTSFIGDLTTPALKDSSLLNDRPRRPVSLVIEQPEFENMTVVGNPVEPTPVQKQTSLPIVAGKEAKSFAKSYPRLMKQGLPSGIKMNISGPIPKAPVEGSTAYERPRPVPPA